MGISIPGPIFNKDWHILKTKPRSEKMVERVLAQVSSGDIVTYLPKLPAKRGLQMRPLFPGYLFFQLTPDSPYWSYVRWAHGVNYIMHDGTRVVDLPPALVEEIKTREKALWQRHDGTERPFKPGELVEIVAGPFEGLEAVFEGPLSDKQRVSVLLAILGRVTSVKLDSEMLGHKA